MPRNRCSAVERASIDVAWANVLAARAAVLRLLAARASDPLERVRLSASASLQALRSSQIAGVPATSSPARQESSDASA